MKFLCDQMLAGIGKWLRAAGHDTLIVQVKMKDADILKWAKKEDRLLLTRDKHFLEIKDACDQILFIRSNCLADWIRELNCLLKINWLANPFSRCLLCNTLFVEPDKETILKLAPSDLFATSRSFWFCPQCKKLYWEGSHTRHMKEQLSLWQKNT